MILELGANDLLRGVPPAKMKENLDKIIEKAKAKNVKILLGGMIAPPTMGADYQRDFSNAFPDLAEKHKVAFLPFLLDGIALKKELNQADGIHPNAEGTRMMMENVYKELQPLLTNKLAAKRCKNRKLDRFCVFCAFLWLKSLNERHSPRMCSVRPASRSSRRCKTSASNAANRCWFATILKPRRKRFTPESV